MISTKGDLRVTAPPGQPPHFYHSPTMHRTVELAFSFVQPLYWARCPYMRLPLSNLVCVFSMVQFPFLVNQCLSLDRFPSVCFVVVPPCLGRNHHSGHFICSTVSPVKKGVSLVTTLNYCAWPGCILASSAQIGMSGCMPHVSTGSDLACKFHSPVFIGSFKYYSKVF